MGWANEQHAAVAEFGEDRNGLSPGRGLLTELWTRLQGARTHPYAPERSDPSITWNGVAAPAQNFKGVGELLGGGLPYRNGGSATISSGLVEGPMGDPARKIFAQRARRRSAMGGA